MGVPVAGDDENGGGWRRKPLFPRSEELPRRNGIIYGQSW